MTYKATMSKHWARLWEEGYAFNTAAEIKVTKHQFESFLQYFRESGYTVSEIRNGEQVTYMAYDCPWYADHTMLGFHAKQSRNRWIYLRVPMKLNLEPKTPPHKLCPACASEGVVRKHINYDAVATHEGRQYHFTIMDFQPLHCNDCNETIFDDEADAQMTQALEAHIAKLKLK